MVRQKLGLLIKKLTANSWNFMLTAHRFSASWQQFHSYLGFGVRDYSGYLLLWLVPWHFVGISSIRWKGWDLWLINERVERPLKAGGVCITTYLFQVSNWSPLPSRRRKGRGGRNVDPTFIHLENITRSTAHHKLSQAS